MLDDAQGGSLTKSAYYLIYISEQERIITSQIDENQYEPHVENFEILHPYGMFTS